MHKLRCRVIWVDVSGVGPARGLVSGSDGTAGGHASAAVIGAEASDGSAPNLIHAALGFAMLFEADQPADSKIGGPTLRADRAI